MAVDLLLLHSEAENDRGVTCVAYNFLSCFSALFSNSPRRIATKVTKQSAFLNARFELVSSAEDLAYHTGYMHQFAIIGDNEVASCVYIIHRPQPLFMRSSSGLLVVRKC